MTMVSPVAAAALSSSDLWWGFEGAARRKRTVGERQASMERWGNERSREAGRG